MLTLVSPFAKQNSDDTTPPRHKSANIDTMPGHNKA